MDSRVVGGANFWFYKYESDFNSRLLDQVAETWISTKS